MVQKAALPSDDLRSELDKLAENIVKDVCADKEATLRQKTDVLKTVGVWWTSSRKGEPTEKVANAWDGYAAQMTNGSGKNGKAHVS